MSVLLRNISQVHTIIALRSAAIVVQILLIFFVNLGLNYQLPWQPLFWVILFEVIFTLASYYFYQGKQASSGELFAQIIADVLFLSLLLYFSGGATNAFVSLLLIPIAIAAVTLSSLMLTITALCAITSYSLLLWLLPMSVMHGNMEGHFIGMGINFLFSTIVVAMVVGKMARSINQRELAIAAYREEQLKQEKVIALGVASAQITHQLATPIATVQLLADELKDEDPENPVISDMLIELARCKESLSAFRQMVFNIKEQASKVTSCQEVFDQINKHLTLNYPDIKVKNATYHKVEDGILVDASLVPAILNLIHNAIRATKANNCAEIELTSTCNNNLWQLNIRDFGQGFALSKLSQLGVKPVSSEQGLGMAVFLSHASLERLGGKLELTNHHKGGALVTLSLPLAKNN